MFVPANRANGSAPNPVVDATVVDELGLCLPPDQQVCEGTYAVDKLEVTKAVAPAQPLSLVQAFSMQQFVAPLKAGDKVAVDGPAIANGSGAIHSLTDDTLDVSFDIRTVGAGRIKLQRRESNLYDVTLTVGDQTYTFPVRQTMKGKDAVFYGEHDPKQKLTFSMNGGTLTIDPDGLKLPGSFDISKE